MRTNYLKIKNIIKNNFDLVITKARSNGLVISDEHQDNNLRCRIVLVNGNEYSNEQGIHIFGIEDLEHHLCDAIQTAEKDMWPTIWIHQKPKPNQEREKSLKKGIKKWVEACDKKAVSRVSVNKNMRFLDLDAVIESLTEDQAQAVLSMMSACYRKAGEEGREFWSPAYHDLRKQVETLKQAGNQ